MHNLYSTGLLNEMMLAPHVFLAYSNLGYYIIKKIQQRMGGKSVLDFWNEPPKYNFHFCYVNCNKNYLINNVDQLFLGKIATMFANQQKFIIHSDNKPCDLLSQDKHQNNIVEDEINNYLTSTYPKNKHLPLVFKILLQHELVNHSLFFTSFPNIHVADFCTFINNKFDKREKSKEDIIKFCKFLQKKQIKLPKVAIKNPVAQKLLT